MPLTDEELERRMRHLEREISPAEENDLYRRLDGGDGPISMVRTRDPKASPQPEDQTGQPAGKPDA